MIKLNKKKKIKDLKLTWVHDACREPPVYVSNEKLLIPSNFSLKTWDLSQNYPRYHLDLQFNIGCCCSSPELGLIAVSERKTKGAIYILNYPEMSDVSVLEQSNNDSYSALEFVGLLFLMSFQIKKSYEIDLWKWHSGERVHSLSIPLVHSGVPSISLLRNPLWWHQYLFHCNGRLILLEVKHTDKYSVHAAYYSMSISKKENLHLSISDDEKDWHKDANNPKMKYLDIQCACWLPECNILVAAPNGILKIDYRTSAVYKLAENKIGVSTMALAKSGLYVGYKNGYIDVVNISGNRWHLEETVKIDQPINRFTMSPEYDSLTVTTIKGSIFYNQIPIKNHDFRCLNRSEFVGKVGVGFIGPLAKLCVTATKNGLIHIFRPIDGNILCTFQIKEEIVSMAASPLCSCVVFGTSCGVLYFIDAYDCKKPRVIHCEKPYDIAVDHLKFDNFGRYLFASAQKQPVKIWNGLPSAGFRQLGSKKITAQVKDMCAFSRAENEETTLLILSEGGTGTDKEGGNILIRLKIPLDFSVSYEMYQIDAFGTLDGDMFSFQKRKLDTFSTKMNLHWTLGAIVYCASVHEVRKYDVWSEFADVQPDKVLAIKNIKSIRLSPNQDWLTLTDFYGTVRIFSTENFTLQASSDRYCSCDSICTTFVEFPASSDSLICVRDNGATLYYEWVDNSSVIHSAPEWVAYCYSQSHIENECLLRAEEQERLDVISEDTENNHEKSLHLNETYQKLLMEIRILNYKLRILFGYSKLLHVSTSKASDFSENFLDNVISYNREKLAVIALDNGLKEEKSVKSRRRKLMDVRVLSSIESDFETENYSTTIIENDELKVEKLNSCSDKKQEKTHPSLSFGKCVKMKSKEDRLRCIVGLFQQICNLKKEFNGEFDNLSQKKPSISEKCDENYLEAWRLSYPLSSKADRDFQSPSVVESEIGRIVESVDTTHTEKVNKKTPEDNSSKQTKRAMEGHVKLAHDMRNKFDYDLKVLLLKRRNCDHKICRLEVTIHCILLFTEEENAFSTWKEEVEEQLKFTDDFEKSIKELSQKVSSIERSLKGAYLELQKAERYTSEKIDVKCRILPQKIVNQVKHHPILQLDDKCQNPFWRACPEINVKDFELIIKEVSVLNQDVKQNQKGDWDNICHKQIRVLNIGVVLRNLQAQLLALSKVKHSLADIDSDIKANRKVLQNAVDHSSMSASNTITVFQNLLENQFENIDEELKSSVCKGDSNMELISSLSPSKSDKTNCEDIDRETWKIMLIEKLLAEIHVMFESGNKLKSEMIIQSKCLLAEFEDLKRNLENALEESEQNMKKANGVVTDKTLGEGKKAFFQRNLWRSP